MSQLLITTALETRLKAMTPELASAFENDGYTPVAGTPYQEVWFKFARPFNAANGPFVRHRGYMQVDLQYPLGEGGGDAWERGEAIAAWFPFGLSVAAGGVITTIDNTPQIVSGRVEGERYKVTVIINFFANIG